MNETIKEYIEEFEEKTGGTVVYVTTSGSKLYGTDTPESDTDYKGLFIPSVDSMILKKDLVTYSKDSNNTKEKNTNEDIDFTLHSINQWFGLLAKSETGSIDMLYSMYSKHNIVWEDKNFTDAIKDNKDIFTNTNMKSFIGYALGQTKKFGIKGARYHELDTFVKYIESTNLTEGLMSNNFKEIEKFIKKEEFKYIKFIVADGPRTGKGENKITYLSVLSKMFSGDISLSYFEERVNLLYNQFGNRTKTIANTDDKNDKKAVSHAWRIASEVRELLTTGFIEFPLKDAEYIKKIKKGEVSFEEAVDGVEEILAEVDELLLTSKMPKEANKEKINEFLLSMAKKYD